jgi:glutathione S-transferase
MANFTEGSKLPPIPLPVLKLIAPGATRLEMRANEATAATYPRDLAALPDLLDRVDAWIAEGVLGGGTPNAADLQIAPSLRLLMCFDDLRPLIEPRPAGALALALFPEYPGHAPAGLIPAELLPAAAAA